jgi:hypothetical protein
MVEIPWVAQNNHILARKIRKIFLIMKSASKMFPLNGNL